MAGENVDELNEGGNCHSPEKQCLNNELGGVEKWPGWPGENVFRMLIPVRKVGCIIGRKGEHIKKLSEETKARIKILDGPPGTSERAVSLYLNISRCYMFFLHEWITLYLVPFLWYYGC